MSQLTVEVPASLSTYFDNLHMTAEHLRAMAEAQRSGAPHGADDLAFINQAVNIEPFCGGGESSGWYPDLFYGDDLEFDPTVTDVHTQPTDEGGAEVGRILHVATGDAQLMVVTVDTCTGPRAYAGLASSYYQFTTDNWERMTDNEWQLALYRQPPAPVPWLEGLQVP